MLKFLMLKVLFMSAAASLCGVFVLGIGRLCGKFFSKRMIYALWTAVIVLSIIPISFSDFNAIRNGGAVGDVLKTEYADVKSSLANGEKSAADGNTVNADVNADNKTGSGHGAEELKQKAAAGVNTEQPIKRTEAAGGKTPFARERKTDLILNIIAAMYLLTAAVLAAALIFRTFRFNRAFRGCCKRADDSLIDEAKKRVGVRSAAKLYTSAAECSPFVFGILRPKVVVSERGADNGAVMHELVHIKHCDVFRLLLINIAKIIHFFNPLMYFFAKETKRYMELACDEEVSALLSSAERISYSAEIIRSAAGFAHGGVCLSENAENIKERIDYVMNGKIYKRSLRVMGAVLAALLIAVQTAFAAGINAELPVRSYAVNNSRKVYSIIYKEGETTHYAIKYSDSKGGASLVNTALFKGFSADMYAEFSVGPYNGGKKDVTPSAVHVEMTKFIKEVYDGRVWQGLFTVTINDEVFMQDAKGYLNEVPGNGARGFARLWIEDEEGGKTFEIEHIDFYLDSDSVINAEYEENLAESFDADFERTINSKNKLILDGKEYEYYNATGVRIRTNRQKGLLDVAELNFPEENGKYMTSVPGGRYTFKDDSVSGKFFIKRYGSVILDEFDATLSGLNSDKITFESADKALKLEMNVEKDTEDYRSEFSHYDPEQQPDMYNFDSSCTTYPLKRLRLSDLPFTLAMNTEKTGLILKIKDGFNPQGWYYSYSSYIGDDTDVYTKYHSKYGKRETFLPFSKSYGTHNLQFTYYDTEPYFKSAHYDICFRVEDGDVVYNSCTEYLTENKNYSGEKAMYFLNQMYSPDFPDEEIKY